MSLTLSRRAAMTAAASLAAAPAAAFAAPPDTPIARLWADAQRLDRALIAHRDVIADAAASHGDAAPGWMYLDSEAGALGEKRYQTIIALLNEEPRSAADRILMARAANDRDMLNGPRVWAAQRAAAALAA